MEALAGVVQGHGGAAAAVAVQDRGEAAAVHHHQVATFNLK